MNLDEFKGLNVNETVEALKAVYPDMVISKVPNTAFVTMDYRLDRLRVYYNEETNKVSRVVNG